MFGVFTFTSNQHTFLPKPFFQRVWGLYKIVVEILDGWGVGNYFSCQKMAIPGRRGGRTLNSLRGGGMDIFWNYALFERMENMFSSEMILLTLILSIKCLTRNLWYNNIPCATVSQGILSSSQKLFNSWR